MSIRYTTNHRGTTHYSKRGNAATLTPRGEPYKRRNIASTSRTTPRRPLIRPAKTKAVAIAVPAPKAASSADKQATGATNSIDTANTPAKKKLALLLPGHNEELIIAITIQSAVAAGQNIEDIYVVDDNSNDKTRAIAVSLLGKSNVLSVKRSGKALAIQKGIKRFKIEQRYEWVHVADADSVFSPDYFHVYQKKLTDKYVVAIGFVQSLRGNWISTYRAICYTYGQHVFRRIQSTLGMVSVFPGPVTAFRTDILKHLTINSRNVTEDFDITLQVHRKKLGNIVYIPKAVNYTQDPQSFHDFRKQSMRWYRGFFQGIQEYRIGLRGQRIDIGIGFQLVQTLVFLLQILVLFPYITIRSHNWWIPVVAISIDFLLTGVIVFASAAVTKRWYLIGVLPYFYFLRTAEIVMYFTAFVEVMILRRFADGVKGWATEGRRYKVDKAALTDVVS